MLASYGQYSAAGFMSSHEPQDIKPYMQCRMPASSSGYHIYQHASPLYPVVHGQPDSLVYVLPSDSKDSTSSDQLPKSAGSRWREEETMALVEIWKDKICQTRWWKQNKCVRVNKEMWDEIAAVLVDRGVFRTASQCQIRMKNLLQYFRQMVDHRRSEKSREELPDYFEIVDSIMSGKGDGAVGHKRMLSDDDETDYCRSIHEEEEDLKKRSDVTNDVAQPGSAKAEASGTNNASSSASPHSGDNKSATSMSPKAICGPGSMNGEDASVMHSPGFMFRRSPQPYTHRGLAVGHHVSQGQDVSTAIHNPTPQRLTFPPRPCFSAMAPPTFVGPYQPSSTRSAERCTGNGCCGEPPAKRHFFDSTCALNHFVQKPVPSVSQGACKLSREGYSTLDKDPPSIASHHSPTSSIKRDHFTMQQHDYPSSSNTFVQRLPTNVGIYEEWMHSVKEILMNQQKQLEMLMEIERHRLRIEEQKLKLQEDADCRNGAFLMEAVRILAEAFGKNDAK